MRASLIFGLIFCTAFSARRSQAEARQAPPACDCQTAATAKPVAVPLLPSDVTAEPAADPWPPGRAMMVGGGFLLVAGGALLGLGIWGSTIREEGGIIQGIGYGLGVSSAAVGGALLGVGIRKSQASRQVLAMALRMPRLHEGARAEELRSGKRAEEGSESAPLLSDLSFAPIVSSGLYGLSLSGRWN